MRAFFCLWLRKKGTVTLSGSAPIEISKTFVVVILTNQRVREEMDGLKELRIHSHWFTFRGTTLFHAEQILPHLTAVLGKFMKLRLVLQCSFGGVGYLETIIH